MMLLAAPLCIAAAPATYTGTAPVNSQSDADRAGALKTALANVVIEQTGDTWSVKSGEQVWQAFDAGHIDDSGELVLVMPPQGGMSGMISIFPEGQFLFTAHAAGPVAISGEGACVATGG